MAAVERSSVIMHGNGLLRGPSCSGENFFAAMKKEELVESTDSDLEVIFVSSPLLAAGIKQENEVIVQELVRFLPKIEVNESENPCEDSSPENASTSFLTDESTTSETAQISQDELQTQSNSIYDVDQVKLSRKVFVSPVLEGIFPNSVRELGKAHSNSGSCSCVYCTGKSELKCDICSVQFESQVAFKRHKLLDVCIETDKLKFETSVKNNVRGKKFKCKICGAAFNLNIALNRHKLRHSVKSKLETSIIKSADGKKFKCKVCSATFKFNIGLKKHQLVHSQKGADVKTANKSKNGLAISNESPCVLKTPIKSKKVLATPGKSPHVFDTLDESKKELVTPNKSIKVLKTPNSPKKVVITLSELMLGLETSNNSKNDLASPIKSARVFESPVESKNSLVTPARSTRVSEIPSTSKIVLAVPRRSNSVLGTSKKKHSVRKLFSCPICPNKYKFKFSNRFSTHMKSVHNDESPFRCDNCSATFRSNDLLSKHKKGVHSSRKYKCSFCPATFKWIGTFNKHEMCHKNQQPSSRSLCAKTFKRNDSSKHRTEVHSNRELFSNKHRLKTLISGNTLSKPYQEVQSSEKVPLFTCDICSDIFSSKSLIMTHMQKHKKMVKRNIGTPNTKRPFSCTVCGRRFNVKCNLVRHMLVHDDMRRYSCNLCPVKFKSTDNLQRHLKNVHRIPLINRNNPSTFKSAASFREHNVLEHAKKPHVPLITCDKCPATFESAASFREHVQTVCVNQTKMQQPGEFGVPQGSVLCPQASHTVKSEVQRYGPSTSVVRPTSPHSNTLALALPIGSSTTVATGSTSMPLNPQVHASKPEVESRLSSLAPSLGPSTSSIAISHSLSPPSSSRELASELEEMQLYPNTLAQSDPAEKQKSLVRKHTGERPGRRKNVLCGSRNRLVKGMSGQFGKNRPLNRNLELVPFKASNSKKYMKSTHKIDRPFSCNICCKTFRWRSNLIRHWSVHSDEKSFKCEQCPAAFKLSDHLTRHKRRVHLNQQIKCNVCPAIFKCQKSLNDHKQTSHPFQPFSCSVCGASFSLRSFLETHMRKHGNERPAQVEGKLRPKKLFPCNRCSLLFVSSVKFSKHMRLMHQIERPFKCNCCSAAFPSSARLKRHFLVHSTNRPFGCRSCPSRFKSKDDLNKHTKAHCAARGLTSSSPATFKRGASLNKRKKAVHRKKPVQQPRCTICSATFTLRNNLLRHYKNVHTNERAFRCSQCNVTFKRKDYLSKHKKKHSNGAHAVHSKKQEQRPTCNICGATFAFRNGLLRHYKEVHTDKRAFSCGQCTATFKCKDSLSKHEKGVHSNEGAFACKVCAATFKRNASRTKHEEGVHSNNQVFRCDVCLTSFKVKSDLLLHSEEAHGDKSLFNSATTFQDRDNLQSHKKLMQKDGEIFKRKLCS